MLILPRYIIRQHIGPFVFGCLVITLLFLLNLIFRELGRFLSKGLDILTVIEFFFLNLAWIIALSVPMAVLTATLMAFGRLSADNEITAIKASGISLYRIIAPVLIASTGLAIFLIWFNNNVLPDFNHRVRVLTSNITTKRPTIDIEPGVMLQMDNFNLMVQKILEEKEGFSLVRNIVIFDKSNPRYNKTIAAERAEILVDADNDQVLLTLYNGEMHEIEWAKLENYRSLKFPRHSLSIIVPNMKLNRIESEYYGDREKSAQVMLKEVRGNRQQILKKSAQLNAIILPALNRFLELELPDSLQQNDGINYRLAGSTKPYAYLPKWKQPESNRIERLISEHRKLLQKVKNEKSLIANYTRKNHVLLVEVHKKYSIPVACIVFIIIGAPLGILSRRGNMAVSGGIGLFFFILYWAFLIAGEELADRQFISPAVAMWAPNVIVGLFGVYLVVSTVKETRFLHFNLNPLLQYFKNKFKFVNKI
ncbi:LptF/LptG family permease [candidate division KSB1 bacterium]|nr:LptF/LptG family permease [candidate division KSB1 bacterium]